MTQIKQSREESPGLQYPFVGVAGFADGGDQIGEVRSAASLERDVDGGVAEADAVVGAVKLQLDDIGALFTNPVFVWGYTHVVLAAVATGALVMLAISAWQLRRAHDAAFTKSAALSISVLVPVSIALILVGSQLGVIETLPRETPER